MRVPLLAFFAYFFLGSTALSAASETLPAIFADQTPHKRVSAHARQSKVCFVFGINASVLNTGKPHTQKRTSRIIKPIYAGMQIPAGLLAISIPLS
ncbi:hypothetical protein EBZ39_06515 [bacterium]|nr:hypothetical protein [bacterium]